MRKLVTSFIRTVYITLLVLFQEEEEEEKVPTVPLSRIMKMNATEWPYILLGCVGAAIQGTVTPLYAIVFGDVFGVRTQAPGVVSGNFSDCTYAEVDLAPQDFSFPCINVLPPSQSF